MLLGTVGIALIMPCYQGTGDGIGFQFQSEAQDDWTGYLRSSAGYI